MLLKLRRKRRSRPVLDDRDLCNFTPIPCIVNKLSETINWQDSSAGLASDVHLCALEYCPESPLGERVVLKKVLIVDDSPAQVKLMQGLLEPEGYQPVGVNDPRRVEEAIVNALVNNHDMTGRDDHRVEALPHARLRQLLKKYHRLQE